MGHISDGPLSKSCTTQSIHVTKCGKMFKVKIAYVLIATRIKLNQRVTNKQDALVIGKEVKNGFLI